MERTFRRRTFEAGGEGLQAALAIARRCGRSGAQEKAASKTKYACPECGTNAWAKPDTVLLCGECYEDGEGDICMMEAEG